MGLTNAYRNYLAQATIGESVTPFDSSNAYIGVGDSTTAFDPTQTDLLGTNKLRKGMDGGYPVRSTNAMTFQATFSTSEGNFAWNEWGVFNASASGTILNRKVEYLGTKTSSQTWQIQVTVTLTVE